MAREYRCFSREEKIGMLNGRLSTLEWDDYNHIINEENDIKDYIIVYYDNKDNVKYVEVNLNFDDEEFYIDNGKDSIKIDIKFTDDDSVHTLEEIYNSGVETFMIYYNEIKFKCTKIEYHQQTNRVSYLYFEQITG